MGRITACAAIVIAMVAFALYGYNYSGTCARRIYLAADEITQAVDKNDTAKAIEKADLAEQLWRKMSQHTIFVEDYRMRQRNSYEPRQNKSICQKRRGRYLFRMRRA